MRLTRRACLGGGAAALAAAAWAGCRDTAPRVASPPATGSTAQRTLEAARRFAGTKLRVGWESGLQAQELLGFTAPRWRELTGIQIEVVELGIATQQLRRILAEHDAGTGGLDCAGIAPAWLPDLAAAGVLHPLDESLARYVTAGDRNDVLPIYRHLGEQGGRTWGLFDDGDALLLYYRRDLFEDEALQREFLKQHGRPLGDPRSYSMEDLERAAGFFAARLAPRTCGMAPLTRELRWGWFQQALRVRGGRYFDPETMRPGVDEPAGIEAMSALARLDRSAPPGASDVDPSVTLSTYLSGGAALAVFWPPLGRLAEETGGGMAGLVRSAVVGRTGYALLPGGCTELSVGFVVSVMANSRHQEAAALFAEWMTCPEVSLRRVLRSNTLRDPYRTTHVEAPEYRAMWPRAPEYLDLLRAAGNGGALLDLTIPGAAQYEEAFYIAATDVRLGTPVPEAMRALASAWEEITDRLGRSDQRRAFEAFLRRPGATLAGAKGPG